MKIFVTIVSYNGMKGHRLISHAGDFLLNGAPNSFGEAIKECDVYLWALSNSAPLPTLERMHNKFLESSRELPRVFFSRKRARIDISILSRSGSFEFFEGLPIECVDSVRVFREICHDICAQLLGMRKKLKRADNFNWDVFESHVRGRLDVLPNEPGALITLVGESRQNCMHS